MKKTLCYLIMLAFCLSLITGCSLTNNSLQLDDTDNQEVLSTQEENADTTTNSSADTDTATESFVESTDKDSVTSTKENEPPLTKLNGRGKSDLGRSEPQYEGITGYVVVYGDSDLSLETPWMIPKYVVDKQFYTEAGFVEHKTQVLVVEQELEHDHHGYYSGYLLVKDTNSSEEFYINVENFITEAYWTYDDKIEAATFGPYIAEFNQVSNYYPVDKDNEKVVLDNGMKILIVGNTGTYGKNGPDKETTQVEAYVFKEWKYGYGKGTVFFNVDDLTITY